MKDETDTAIPSDRKTMEKNSSDSIVDKQRNDFESSCITHVHKNVLNNITNNNNENNPLNKSNDDSKGNDSVNISHEKQRYQGRQSPSPLSATSSTTSSDKGSGKGHKKKISWDLNDMLPPLPVQIQNKSSGKPPIPPQSPPTHPVLKSIFEGNVSATSSLSFGLSDDDNNNDSERQFVAQLKTVPETTKKSVLPRRTNSGSDKEKAATNISNYWLGLIKSRDVNPLGDEAEAAVLKAFEQREKDEMSQDNRGRQRPGAPRPYDTLSPLSILRNVTNETQRSKDSKTSLSRIREIEFGQKKNVAAIDDMSGKGSVGSGTPVTGETKKTFRYLARLAIASGSTQGVPMSPVPTPTNSAESASGDDNTMTATVSSASKDVPPGTRTMDHDNQGAVNRRSLFIRNTTSIYRRKHQLESPLNDTFDTHFIDLEAAAATQPPVDEERVEDYKLSDDNNDHNKDTRRLCCGKTNVRRSTNVALKTQMRQQRDLIATVFKPKLKKATLFIKSILLIIIPSLTTACILYYIFDNPLVVPLIDSTTDANDATNELSTSTTPSSHPYGSYSWWILFIGVRQVLTLTISKTSEMFVIDLFALRTSLCTFLLGPLATLIMASSRGWPYDLCLWALWDLALLYGTGPFARHWLYWQDRVEVFSVKNPAGVAFLASEGYLRLLISAIVLGVAAGVKRVWFGMHTGRRTYRIYGSELNKIMSQISIMTEVSQLAAEVDNFSRMHGNLVDPAKLVDATKANSDKSDGNDDSDAETEDEDFDEDDDADRDASTQVTGDQKAKNGMLTSEDPGRQIGSSDHLKLMEMIGDWEEPKVDSQDEHTSVHNVLDFFNVLSYMSHSYPFSFAFGMADTREACINSAEKVYNKLRRLDSASPDDNASIPFSTLCAVALDDKGDVNQHKVKTLRRLFRPNRKNRLSQLDFIKTCDYVYKKLKTFRAAVHNSSQIDQALERIINVVFYFIMGMIVLAINKIDPIYVLVSVSGIVLSFAFAFGSAASKYFEGILFILVRRPFDVGDRIAVSPVHQDTSPSGSYGWIVESVSLFATTVRFAATGEVATYSNGSLAQCRIINMRRSPKAMAYTYMKFGVDVPYEKVKLFRAAVESFIKDRPREWLSMDGFRATAVQADLGYIEYVIVTTHFDSWQNVKNVSNSKSQLACYCLEVAKKLEMRYVAPPLPVNLAIAQNLAKVQVCDKNNEKGEGVGAAIPDSMVKDLSAFENVENISMSQLASIAEWFRVDNAKTAVKKKN